VDSEKRHHPQERRTAEKGGVNGRETKKFLEIFVNSTKKKKKKNLAEGTIDARVNKLGRGRKGFSKQLIIRFPKTRKIKESINKAGGG